MILSSKYYLLFFLFFVLFIKLYSFYLLSYSYVYLPTITFRNICTIYFPILLSFFSPFFLCYSYLFIKPSNLLIDLFRITYFFCHSLYPSSNYFNLIYKLYILSLCSSSNRYNSIFS